MWPVERSVWRVFVLVRGVWKGAVERYGVVVGLVTSVVVEVVQ